jgi:hypothetical protein
VAAPGAESSTTPAAPRALIAAAIWAAEWTTTAGQSDGVPLRVTVDPAHPACQACSIFGKALQAPGHAQPHLGRARRRGLQGAQGIIAGMSGSSMDPVAAAAARLEAAVDRLAQVAAQPRPAAIEAPAATVIMGVPRTEVLAIAARLDEAIAKLRAALAEDEGEDPNWPR